MKEEKYTLRDVYKSEEFIEDLINTYQVVRGERLPKELRDRILQLTLDYSLEAYFTDIDYWIEELEDEKTEQG